MSAIGTAMHGNQPDELRDFGRRLQLLAKGWRRTIDQSMRRYGLTDATWRPLLLLGELGDGVRQTDLADMMGIEGPSLVRLLDTLERAHLVERIDSVEDRRSKTLRITQAGNEIYIQVANAYDSAVQTLLDGVAAQDLLAARRLFSKIERNIETHPDPGNTAGDPQ